MVPAPALLRTAMVPPWMSTALRTKALAEVSLRRSHLRLTGPPHVRKIANATHWRFAAALLAALEDEPNAIDLDYEGALLASMKDDLGYELAEKDVSALAWTPPRDPA